MEGFTEQQIKQLREIIGEVTHKLETRMETGFAALADDIGDARTEFEQFRQETRENFQETRENFTSLHAELRDIRQRLEALEEATRNNAGLTKEIDYLMERVSQIEKHIGFRPKIAA